MASLLASLPERQRSELLDDLTEQQLRYLLWDWKVWARPSQLPPDGDWRTWLVLAGRGFGKTRLGAEWVRAEIEQGRRKRLALIGPTAADVRDVMVEGESGILAIAPPWFRPTYEPSKRRLTWPNGAVATTYSADEPDRLRGPQHDGAWADELAAWRYPAAWAMLQFGLRLGSDPRTVVTTTPRPTDLIRALVADPNTATTRGSTMENQANLAPQFLSEILAKYEGTRLGRQEIHAEILADTPGALWSLAMLEDRSNPPDLSRVVVAIDPAVTSGEDSDETGIIVAGLGVDGRGYVLADRSCKVSPVQWAKRALAAYHEYKADTIVAEVNNGGDLVTTVIKTLDNTVPIKTVHASRGKQIRAQPIASLYEQGRISHCGVFAKLEDQLTTWSPEDGRSPDRLDALVWAMTELMLGQRTKVAFL